MLTAQSEHKLVDQPVLWTILTHQIWNLAQRWTRNTWGLRVAWPYNMWLVSWVVRVNSHICHLVLISSKVSFKNDDGLMKVSVREEVTKLWRELFNFIETNLHHFQAWEDISFHCHDKWTAKTCLSLSSTKDVT